MLATPPSAHHQGRDAYSPSPATSCGPRKCCSLSGGPTTHAHSCNTTGRCTGVVVGVRASMAVTPHPFPESRGDYVHRVRDAFRGRRTGLSVLTVRHFSQRLNDDGAAAATPKIP